VTDRRQVEGPTVEGGEIVRRWWGVGGDEGLCFEKVD
jgi:hypothetical protein